MIMQGKKQYTPTLFVSFYLTERVPADNFYRRLREQLDLRWLYKATAKYYGTEGQESIDPVVFFRLMLIGYLGEHDQRSSDNKDSKPSAGYALLYWL